MKHQHRIRWDRSLCMNMHCCKTEGSPASRWSNLSVSRCTLSMGTCMAHTATCSSHYPEYQHFRLGTNPSKSCWQGRGSRGKHRIGTTSRMCTSNMERDMGCKQTHSQTRGGMWCFRKWQCSSFPPPPSTLSGMKDSWCH
jgi:hypothetical protein